MDMGDVTGLVAVCLTLLGFPWLILHYITRWRAARGISQQDEQLLDDLYNSARRLDQRLDSIERIIAAENPNWKDGRLADHSTTTTERRLGH